MITHVDSFRAVEVLPTDCRSLEVLHSLEPDDQQTVWSGSTTHIDGLDADFVRQLGSPENINPAGAYGARDLRLKDLSVGGGEALVLDGEALTRLVNLSGVLAGVAMQYPGLVRVQLDRTLRLSRLVSRLAAVADIVPTALELVRHGDSPLAADRVNCHNYTGDPGPIVAYDRSDDGVVRVTRADTVFRREAARYAVWRVVGRR